jgi:hypothetical protein
LNENCADRKWFEIKNLYPDVIARPALTKPAENRWRSLKMAGPKMKAQNEKACTARHHAALHGQRPEVPPEAFIA